MVKTVSSAPNVAYVIESLGTGQWPTLEWAKEIFVAVGHFQTTLYDALTLESIANAKWRGLGKASMALAKTILSLDRAYRVDGIWSASPILLQLWLRDHPRVIEPPRLYMYEPSQYRSRRVVVRLESEDELLK
ncbi:hypothetical protein JCGZ_04212 [Jatropha curcas]|uniref:Uncharacterized protein n=1 Tax=Jatropha curcas TaxID=180498 RepID=A0A067JKQ4_JATCU|nr:hypothetical protein JCGZ_04212 [Jatropha curcas]